MSALFPDPLYFEKEYCADMFSIAKKMYAMKIYGKAEDGSDDYIKMKGLAPVRRDRCAKIKTMYTGVMETIFNDELTPTESLSEAHETLFNHCLGIVRREVPIDQLVMIKGLGKDYKSDSYFMKVFAEELKRRGRPAEPGAKLKYLVVAGEGNLGNKMRLPEQYFEALCTSTQETLDYLYYVNNGQMIIDRIFGIAYDGILRSRRTRRNAFAATEILDILAKQGLADRIDQARAIRTTETGQRFTTDEVLILWIKDQIISHSVGEKKKVIQALKTKVIQLYYRKMNTERMVTGIITQNPILTAIQIFETKQTICQEIEKYTPIWELTPTFSIIDK